MRFYGSCLMVMALAACAGGSADSGSGGSSPTTSSSSAGGMGGTGMGGSVTSTGGGGSTGDDPCTMDATQLLVSEIVTQPSESEFVEIWNPFGGEVDLSSMHLSDNAAYYGIAAGTPWMPQGTAETDFLAQFPPGTSIAAGGLLTIEMGTDFEGTYGSCPDLTMRGGATCNGNPIPQMLAPTGGGIGANIGSLLSNGGEMAVLFCYSGGDRVYDVDYVTWDSDPDANTHVDKSAVPGYQLDTPEGAQSPAPAPMMIGESVGRCSSAETGETAMSGNGALGHDETSEDFAVTFQVIAPPSPGVENVCN
jgi:hypothetical protein